MLLVQCGDTSKELTNIVVQQGLSNANTSTFTKMINFHCSQVIISSLRSHLYVKLEQCNNSMTIPIQILETRRIAEITGSLLLPPHRPPPRTDHPHLQRRQHDCCHGIAGNVSTGHDGGGPHGLSGNGYGDYCCHQHRSPSTFS